MSSQNNDDLMMTKEEITIAITQLQKIKSLYPEFYKFHLMLLELNKHELLVTTKKVIKK